MGKVTCDVCGTAYPESASQCPICGCVRSADGAASSDSLESSAQGSSYTYVKGGRFSKANVRKRNQGMPQQDMPQFQETSSEQNEENNKADKGLVVAVCVLLLAIVAVVIYIVTRFFAPGASGGSGDNALLIPQSSESVVNTTFVPETTEVVIPTTEETVEPTVEETVEETTEASVPTGNYYVEPYTLSTEKRKNDVTIYRSGTFELELRDATGELMDIDWEVEDPEICSVEGNTITGLKAGKTTVKVTINGVTYACIVRVKA